MTSYDITLYIADAMIISFAAFWGTMIIWDGIEQRKEHKRKHSTHPQHHHSKC